MGYQTFWHGSPFPRRKLAPGSDGGIHLGTREQAQMRSAAFLHEAVFDTGRVRRSRDTGGDWAGKIASARRGRYTSIVYLNRWEGLDARDLEAATLKAAASDAEFRKAAPSAQDSCIALYAEDVTVRRVLPGPGLVTLFHGTSRQNAQDLMSEGFRPETWRKGGNGGGRGLLYLTTSEEDARWFSNEIGEDTVLRVMARANALIVDPEDGTGSDVAEEMIRSQELGLPAKLATRSPVGPEMVSLLPQIGGLGPQY